jgi:HEAT repeat protein
MKMAKTIAKRLTLASAAVMAAVVIVSCRKAEIAEKPAGQKIQPDAGVVFTFGPQLSSRSTSEVIKFAVSENTDVTVMVRDAAGYIVRHLASGVLGENPPPPFAAGSLKQEILWDRRDDAGVQLPSGQYHISVNLGLSASYAGSIGSDPRAIGRIHGLAVGPGGSLYVMSGVGRDSGDGRFQVFSGAGKYLRTILPRSASLPLERVKSLGEMVLAGGERFPTCLSPQYAARIFQVPLVTRSGDLVFVNGLRRGSHPEGKRFQSVAHLKQWPRRLLRLAADGGAPGEGYLGPLLGQGFEKKPVFLASPDGGKTIYFSGAGHAVFRVKWGQNEKPEVFVGRNDKSGAGKKSLKDPAGIAFDARGNLYVADRGNHRIVCFDSSGNFTGEISVEWPQAIAVDSDKGEIYAACGYRNFRLLKYESIKSVQPCAELNLGRGWPILVLGSENGQQFVYVANADMRKKGSARRQEMLVRFAVQNGKFIEDGRISNQKLPLQPLLHGVDRQRERVFGVTGMFAKAVRWDGQSGEMISLPELLHPKANGIRGLTASTDGMVVYHAKDEHGRFDAALKPLPFAGSGTYIARLVKEDCPRSLYDRGSCVSPANGRVYHVHERGGYQKPMLVSAMDRDGIPEKNPAITFESRSAAAVRVDRQGNIYVLDHLKPIGKAVPDVFKGVVPLNRHNPFVYNYGSVLKFGPDGGKVKELSRGKPVKRQLQKGQIQFTTAEGRGDFVSTGAAWAWFGVSMIQPALNRNNYCMCWHPRFDVDDFSRVFLPDQLRCRIVVLDTNGNQITSIGRYGNVDDKGPDVPLADPRTVMVSDRTIYIGDMSNNRIARANITYRSSKSLAVEIKVVLEKLPAALISVRAEVLKVSLELARSINWRAVAAGLKDDAQKVEVLRATVCRVAGHIGDVDALEHFMKSKNTKVRLAAVWSLYGEAENNKVRSLLQGALADDQEKVRLAAADSLLASGDPVGMAEVFKGARSEDPDVYKLAETVMLKKLIVWDVSNPKAGLVEPGKCYASRFELDKNAVKALGKLLVDITRKDTKPGGKHATHWHMRAKSIYLLALSGRPEAVKPLLSALRLEKKQTWGRNRNRLIAAMGILRVRESVPDLLAYLQRGKANAYMLERGDKAELMAATALERIADPKSVASVIKLLSSSKKQVRELSRRLLSKMFEGKLPEDRLLIPDQAKLIPVRIDDCPSAEKLAASWAEFWQENARKYQWDADAGRIKLK